MLASIIPLFRNKFFWALDSVNGSKIKKAYEEIKNINENSSNDKNVVKYLDTNIQKLLKHATKTTEFYKEYEELPLSAFPIISKDLIREKQNDFLSSSFNKEKLFKMATSGSTGTPFVVYQNEDKKRRVNAEIIYYSEKAGYSVGNKLLYLRAVTNLNKKPKSIQWIQNQAMIDISSLTDVSVEKILTRINKESRNGSTILAYASTFDVLRDYFSRNERVCSKLTSNVKGIISSSEMLFDDTRLSLEKAYKCKVFSRYSNQENGVIGQDEEENNVFLLNDANYVVEIFDMKSDCVVPEGTVGRIVVTDLYNFAMPLIRYDTGDVGSLTTINKNGKMKRAINNFGGRQNDIIFDSKGNRISPHSITNNFWNFSGVRQYQIIQQNEYEYLIRLSLYPQYNQLEEIRRMLNKQLGDGAKIEIEVVEDIPVLASGKRKYVINNMRI